MALKNQALTIQYVAWNTSTNSGQTGDAGNHTLRAVGDGAEFTPGESPAEVDSTNLKGVYKLALQASEMDYNCVTVGGVSSTSNVVIIPVTITTERGVLPTVAPTEAGGLITVGTGSGQIEPDSSGNVTVGGYASGEGPPSAAQVATAVGALFEFDGSGNVKSAAQTLPNPAPSGYGGSGGGSDPLANNLGSYAAGTAGGALQQVAGMFTTNTSSVLSQPALANAPGGAGSGTTAVTQSSGGSSRSPSDMTVENASGTPIQGAVVQAYLTSAWAASPAAAEVLAVTSTDAFGDWTLYIQTGVGACTIVASYPGVRAAAGSVTV